MRRLIGKTKILRHCPRLSLIAAETPMHVEIARRLAIIGPGKRDELAIRQDSGLLILVEDSRSRGLTDRDRRTPRLSLVVGVDIDNPLKPLGRVVVLLVGLDAGGKFSAC